MILTMKKARLMLVALLLLKLCWAYPQTDLPAEKITLHTNADFLLTGETLFFKLYCQYANSEKSTLSKIAYIEVISSEGKSVLQAKVGLTDGEGAGDFFLTSKLESDHYTIIAYTQWMKNFSYRGFFRKEITIINPFRIQMQTNFNNVTDSTQSNFKLASEPQEQIVSLRTKRESYSTREKVTVTIVSNSGLIGNLSVGVHPISEVVGSQYQSSAWSETGGSSGKYLPELRGKLITGTITDAERKPLAEKLVFLSVPSKEYYFHAARSDLQGKFNFIIESLQLSRHLVIQVDKSDSAVSVILNKDFLEAYTGFLPTPFRFNPSFTRTIEKRSVYSQIENSYYNMKRDSTISSYPGRFYNNPDKVYLLDAYTRFPTMEDVFREYILEVIVKKRGENYELKVMDGKTRLPFNGDPIILLDGILIKDSKTVMSYSPQLLKKIEIVTKKYFLGPSTMNGIISLETFEGDFRKLYLPSESQFNYEGLQPSKLYFAPNYNSTHAGLERIPDYRVQLVWIPSLKLANRSSDIDFFTSDVPGDFEIMVQGISKENGPFTVRHRFTVVP